MREIKFRAWDKRKQTWYHKIVEWVFGRPKGSLGQLPELSAEVVLMQYTGLKDKNGKEIYEGDIVQFQADVLDDGSFGDSLKPAYFVLAKVVFMGSAFRFEYGGNVPLAHSACEIIGNIYENSELLEGK